ncbi:MAG TPA: electron transport complex subunit RsxB [Gammaproteobacteria bacterium]
MITPVLVAVTALALLALAFGVLLGYASLRFKVEGNPIVIQIDALLPQTQCGQCGYAGCKQLAEAIARDEASIDACPPGGMLLATDLADLLGRDLPHGHDTTAAKVRELALIDQQTCIGCTKCIQACPVDAILGAGKQMHSVLQSECTGCRKCVEPCPVEAITMVPVTPRIATWSWPFPQPRRAA